MHITQFLEPANDERLEQHEGHLLGQTALVQLEFGADDDHGTARVIHAFTEQVLTETSALSLEHVGERLESTVARTGYGATMAAVVEERVHGFLQHALLVADDDFGRLELKQVLQPVVAVDDAAIQIVQVGGGKTAAFERNQRTQIRRNHRQHRQESSIPAAPCWTMKPCKQLDALGELLANLFAPRLGHGLLQLRTICLRRSTLRQRFAHRFGTHLGHERIIAVGFARLAVFVLAEQLILLERRVAGIDDHVVLVVNHALEIARGHVEHETDAARACT